MLEAVIFDLDGTLWDATEGILRTWNEVIARHPESRRGVLEKAELSTYLGLPMKEIADRMFPFSTTQEKEVFMAECCALENAYLKEHGGILYPGLLPVLLELKKHYRLFICSNCQSGYIESFLVAHGLCEIFNDTQCWGDNPVSKGQNNLLLMRRNGVKKAVYVGDTLGDEASAEEAGIPFLHAAYGFGSARAPQGVLSSLQDLPACLQALSRKG